MESFGNKTSFAPLKRVICIKLSFVNPFTAHKRSSRW